RRPDTRLAHGRFHSFCVRIRMAARRVSAYPGSPPSQELPMLALRPTCEHCDTALPPASSKARICSFECTFCADCAEGLLGNVCPNCGGGFAPRPVRPASDRKGGNYLGRYPASTER